MSNPRPTTARTELRHRLAFRLILPVILFSLAVTIAGTAVTLYQEYQGNIAAIEKRLAELEESSLGSISENTWLLDTARLEILLDGVTRLPDVAYAAVLGSSGEVLVESGARPLSRPVVRAYPLVHKRRDKEIAIGTFSVVATLDGAMERLLARVGEILAATALNTFFVAVFVYFVVHRLVTRHLETLSRYARAFSLDKPPAAVTDFGSDVGQTKGELKELYNALTDTQEELRSSYASLRELNENLEVRVAERTEDLSREIDERQRVEDVLRRTLELNEELIAASPIGIAVFDDTGQCVDANEALAGIAGGDVGDLLRVNYTTSQVWERTGLRTAALTALTEMAAQEVTISETSSLGRRVDLYCLLVPIGEGDAARMMLMAMDISDRLQAERALRRSEQRFRDLAESASEWFWETDADHRFVVHHGAGPETINIPRSRIYGFTRWEVMGKDDIARDPEGWRQHRDDLDAHRLFRNFEYAVTGDDGVVRYISISGKPLFEENGDFIGYRGIGVDISERKQQERLIAELGRRNELLLDAAGEGIYGLDADGRCSFVNPAAERMLGWSRDRLAGADLHALVHHTSPDGLPRSPEDSPIRKTLSAGEGQTEHDDVFWREDGSSFPVEYTATPIYENDAIIGAVVVFRDMTQQRAMQAQLVQTSKMATLGEMATGVAHELNQPLNVIRMVASNIQRKSSRGDVTADYLSDKLERIDANVGRAAAIIDHMRTFGRKSDNKKQALSGAAMVESALEMIGEQLRLSGITIATRYAENCPMLSGNQIQLEQVVLNLLSNARDALFENEVSDKRIDIEVTPCMDTDCGGMRAECARCTSRGVTIMVRDNAGGIDDALKDRIFEPFFTTKDVGKGTGLGLSISYGIVIDLGGTIDLLDVDGGAAFAIRLPEATADELAETKHAIA